MKTEILLKRENVPLSTHTCISYLVPRACVGSRHFCACLFVEGLGINSYFNHLHEQKTRWITV